MSLQTWHQTLARQTAAGTLFNTYTTSKTVINADALYVLPANDLRLDRAFSLRVQGAISNLVTTPGTITFEVKIGGVVAFTTGALQMSSTAHTLAPFWLDIDLTVRAIGSSTSANLMGQGRINCQAVNATAVADGTQTHSALLAPNTAPAVGTGFDSTIGAIWDFWAGFSISNAANGVQIQQYRLVSEL